MASQNIVPLIFKIQCQCSRVAKTVVCTTKYSLDLSSAFLTYAVHAAQSREGTSCHVLDAVLVDPHLNQRGGQVLGDSGQQILGEIELLHVLQRDERSGVDFGNKVIPQRQTL